MTKGFGYVSLAHYSKGGGYYIDLPLIDLQFGHVILPVVILYYIECQPRLIWSYTLRCNARARIEK